MNMGTKDKYAFFTIDVERFADTECVYNTGVKIKQTMLDGLDRYIEMLEKHNIKATLFVLSDLAEEIVEKLKHYIQRGHKLALHGKNHAPLDTISNEQFEEQIVHARNKLEKMFGVPIVGYRAPCFSIDRDKLDILRRLGFVYDSSCIDFSAARHTTDVNMDDFKVSETGALEKKGFYEFGLSTQKVFGKNFPVSGGGYIRLSNWLFAQSLIHKYIKKNINYVFYLHPFEFSKERMPILKNLKAYDKYYLKYGKNSYPYKVECIIKKLKRFGFKFATFEEVSAGIE